MLYDRKGLVENTSFVLLILGLHEVILLFIASTMDSQRKRVVCFFWSSCTKDIYVEQRRWVTSLVYLGGILPVNIATVTVVTTVTVVISFFFKAYVHYFLLNFEKWKMKTMKNVFYFI